MRKIYNITRNIHYLWKRLTNQYYALINKMKFILLGVNYGSRCIVHGHLYLKIGKNAFIEIGDNLCFLCGRALNPLSRNSGGVICVNENGLLKIGCDVGISSAVIWVHESITIGNNVNVGANSILMDSDAHSLEYLDRRVLAKDVIAKKNKPIVIEDDVLIGVNCIILKGVTIGSHSVIGAGSVVVHSIPPDCIAAGKSY